METDIAQLVQMAPPAAPVNLEDRGKWFLTDARRRSAQEQFEKWCPQSLRTTDWNRPVFTENREAIAKIRAWKFGPVGIVASGPTGTGKTRAMWDLVKHLMIDDLMDVTCLSVHSFFSRINEHVEYGRDDAAGWVHAVAGHQILFLDDFGQHSLLQSRTDWAMGWFFDLVEFRVGRSLPLLVTTNLSSSEMASPTAVGSEVRGDPLLRRVLELCEPVVFRAQHTRPGYVD